jgi:uncharacterized OB-fold protein
MRASTKTVRGGRKAQPKASSRRAYEPRPTTSPGGTVVYSENLLVIQEHYETDYIHSYAEDSEFFLGLSTGKLLGSECTSCRYRFATPRAYCLQCGSSTKWIDLPLEGRVHSWTTCHYGSEAFLNQTPFHLVLVEFEGVDTLLMARLVPPKRANIRIGQKVHAKFVRKPKHRVTDVYFVPV